ncbi:hypothetical protein RB653_000811 [Dictyostelium firmibasis]|uniref:Uncharacterized protein n=1 Tax=Dictyostelium firmibasis TaxID=79012 RepID=A0AAN7TXD3_9MYCE
MAKVPKYTYKNIKNSLCEIDEILKIHIHTFSDKEKQNFIKYLNNDSNFRLTKEQYLVLKSIFNDGDNGSLKSEELGFVESHGDYISLTYSEIEAESFYLSLITPIRIFNLKGTSPDKRKEPVLKVLISNFPYITFETKNKIIEALVNLISNDNCGVVSLEYLFLTIQLILSSKKQQQNIESLLILEDQIKEYINSRNFNSICGEFFKIMVNVPNIEYLIGLDVSNYIIDCIEKEEKEDEDELNIYLVLLLYSRWDTSLSCFVKKYKKQIIDSICKDNNQVVFLESFSMKKERFSSILSLLIDNGQLDFHFFLSIAVFLHCLSENSPTDNLILIFQRTRIGYDVLVQLFILMKKEFPTLIKRQHISDFVDGTLFPQLKLIPKNSQPKIKTVLRIDEDQYINQLGQDEYKLFELYKISFELMIVKDVSYDDVEFILEDYLFHNIEKSKVKQSFIKEKLHYLIQVLNINSINRYLLPLFKEKCEKSQTYQLKLKYYSIAPSFSSSASNFNSTSSSIEPIFQDVLIKDIIFHYVECKSTTFFQKLQLSLVCKKFSSIVKSIINHSKNNPIAITNFKFLNRTRDFVQTISSTSKLLFTPSLVKNLKINVGILENENSKTFNILEKFESLETLQLIYYHEPLIQTLTYLNWRLSKPNNKLKKITFYFNEADNEDFGSNIECVQILKNKFGKKVEILIETNYLVYVQDLMTSSGGYKIKVSDFNKLSLPFFSYFEEGFLKSPGATSIKKLCLKYESGDSPNIIRYLKKHYSLLGWKNTTPGELPFQLLESLEFQLYEPHSSYFNVLSESLKFFGNKITSNLKEIIISKNKLEIGSIKHHIEIVLKLISNNPQYSNISKVTAINFFSGDQPHWKSINSHSFVQSICNENSSYTIEFFRLPSQLTVSSGGNKRKFGEIEPTILSNQNNDDSDDFDIDFQSEDELDAILDYVNESEDYHSDVDHDDDD